MSEPSILIGISISLFIVISGIVIYYLFFVITPFDKMAKRQKKMENSLNSQENQLVKLNEKVDQKRIELDDLSKKFVRGMKQITNIKNLRKVLRVAQIENKQLKTELGKMEKEIKAKPKLKKSIEKSVEVMSNTQNNFNGLDHIKQKYHNLPKNQLERIEIERTVVRYLMGKNNGTFYVSQIIRTIEELYLKDIKPNDRIMLLNEIKIWIERDPLCKVIKTTDTVQHYTLI